VKYVIDANVGIAAIMPEKNSAKALQLRADFRKGIHELFAPGLYFLEVGNSLVNHARAGRYPATDLPFAYQEMMRHQPVIVPTRSLFPRAYAIASQYRASVYDAIYLALGEQENCPLVTGDGKLIKAVSGFNIVPIENL
jgi:predicted nucleic acid-binding protein